MLNSTCHLIRTKIHVLDEEAVEHECTFLKSFFNQEFKLFNEPKVKINVIRFLLLFLYDDDDDHCCFILLEEE